MYEQKQHQFETKEIEMGQSKVKLSDFMDSIGLFLKVHHSLVKGESDPGVD